MRIRAERDDLVDVLSRAARAVGTRAPLPILQGLYVEVVGKTLAVTGTDLDLTIRTELEVEVLEDGAAVLPARYAVEAVRKLPPGAIVLQAQEGEVEISGGGPVFRFRGFPVDDFPKLTDPDLSGAVEIDGAALESAIAQVAVATASDDGRPVLTGVHFEEQAGALRMVATDSYRLAVRDVPAAEVSLTGLVPVRALREAVRAIGSGQIKVAIGEREAAFASTRGTVTTRLIEGTFPDYRRLLPDGYPNKLRIDRRALLEAIDRASLVAEEHIPVRLALQEGGVEVSVSRQDVGGEVEHVEAEYTGEEMTIAFNNRYLNDGVTAIGVDTIELEVLDPLKPAVLRGEGEAAFLYLLMPVRL